MAHFLRVSGDVEFFCGNGDGNAVSSNNGGQRQPIHCFVELRRGAGSSNGGKGRNRTAASPFRGCGRPIIGLGTRNALVSGDPSEHIVAYQRSIGSQSGT
jgi:hypothetical protein